MNRSKTGKLFETEIIDIYHHKKYHYRPDQVKITDHDRGKYDQEMISVSRQARIIVKKQTYACDQGQNKNRESGNDRGSQ